MSEFLSSKGGLPRRQGDPFWCNKILIGLDGSPLLYNISSPKLLQRFIDRLRPKLDGGGRDAFIGGVDDL